MEENVLIATLAVLIVMVVFSDALGLLAGGAAVAMLSDKAPRFMAYH